MGRSLLVGTVAARVQPAAILSRLGWTCVEMDDPYSAMVELAGQPQNYSSLIVSLNSLFGEELAFVATVKRRWAHIEIWLTRGEGMNGLQDEALRLGADGVLNDDGPHRLAPPETDDSANGPPLADPVLSAEELKALLDDSPGYPA
ncbi:MAG TPA: hypothetical protein VL992_10510 [Tepidisphaeraceae bacterium]|nr:hypothetical protein [Tepidisphaeraceae bacterium]